MRALFYIYEAWWRAWGYENAKFNPVSIPSLRKADDYMRNDDNDSGLYQGYYQAGNDYDGKIRNKSFWQRYRWLIISGILVALVLIFASTTFYLLARGSGGNQAPRPTPGPATVQAAGATATTAPATPTDTPSLAATVTDTTTAPTTTLTTTTKDYKFVCVTGCDDNLSVTLNNLNINASSNTMVWNFTVTNNGSICNSMSGSITLQSPTGNQTTPDGGSFTQGLTVNAGQTLPRTATFSSAPQRNIQYTVELQMSCNTTATYQPVLLSY